MGDSFLPVDNTVRVKLLSQKPAALTPETEFVSVIGQIRGYDFQPDCTITFRMNLIRRDF